MKLVIVLCLVFICFVRQGHGTFAEFMSNLPSEVGHAFEVAWTSITDAIKKPVKSKRLRPAGKRRTVVSRSTVKSTTFTPTTETSHFHIEFKKNFNAPSIDYMTSTKSGIRLKIPLIDKPLFKSIYEWRQLQKPRRFATQIRFAPPTATAAVSTAPIRQFDNTNLDYNAIFGPLIFI